MANNIKNGMKVKAPGGIIGLLVKVQKGVAVVKTAEGASHEVPANKCRQVPEEL